MTDEECVMISRTPKFQSTTEAIAYLRVNARVYAMAGCLGIAALQSHAVNKFFKIAETQLKFPEFGTILAVILDIKAPSDKLLRARTIESLAKFAQRGSLSKQITDVLLVREPMAFAALRAVDLSPRVHVSKLTPFDQVYRMNNDDISKLKRLGRHICRNCENLYKETGVRLGVDTDAALTVECLDCFDIEDTVYIIEEEDDEWFESLVEFQKDFWKKCSGDDGQFQQFHAGELDMTCTECRMTY